MLPWPLTRPRPMAIPPKQMFYCHTKHRFDLLDMEFFEQLEACGLCCEEVGAGRGGGRWLRSGIACDLGEVGSRLNIQC